MLRFGETKIAKRKIFEKKKKNKYLDINVDNSYLKNS